MAMFKIWGETASPAPRRRSRPARPVAIVYVDGLIIPGSSKPSPFGGGGGFATSSDIRRALDKALEDDNVKAVVLRVDSQGGSAVASEIILDATKRVAAKKPFIVSMGNVAGSGGYYVACGADTIFADETTITGSIGVVAGKFVTNPMWDKIGITFTNTTAARTPACSPAARSSTTGSASSSRAGWTRSTTRSRSTSPTPAATA
jgi:protease-4